MDREKNLSKEIQALALLQKNALGSIFVDRSQSIWPRNCIKAYVISKWYTLKKYYDLQLKVSNTSIN